MITTTLSGLRDYLFSTLSPSNMRWLGEQLTEYADRQDEIQKSYTKEELLERAESARKRIASGHFKPIEDVLKELETEMKFE